MFDKKKMQGGGMLLGHVTGAGKVQDDYEDEGPAPGDRMEALKTIASELIDAVHARDPDRLAQCLDALTAVGDDEAAEGEPGQV